MNSNHFLRNESGATTVEWVVLTAAVIAVLGTVTVIISSGVFNSSSTLSEEVEASAHEPDQTEADFHQKTITLEELQEAPVEPEKFTNWDAANKWIDACIKTGGVPEISASSITNADGSPSEITCI